MARYCWQQARRARTAVVCAALLTVFVAVAPDVFAANLETLIMPGPVAEAHIEHESECVSCHARFGGKPQRALCLDCHEEIAADVAEPSGFHGRVAAGDVPCAACHTEHKGRDADIVGLVTDVFDHSLTDFALEDSHQFVACASCHEGDVKYRDTPTTCVGCHLEDDRHLGGLGEDCAACHVSTRWPEVTFDHEATTDYLLEGAHEGAQCAACHVNEIYDEAPSDCVGCHRSDDVHSGSRGDDCASCHSQNEWDATRFDHERETGFALQESHAELQCQQCHLTGMQLETPATTCHGCHATDDKHLGKNGTECDSCHGQSEWALTFDHAAHTGFALEGPHGLLSCDGCHREATLEALPTDCASCHEVDDPHNGEFADCDSCHGGDNWFDQVRFHHDLTNFPLLGSHRLAACEQCHDGLAFVPPLGETCADCHSDVGVHDGSFGSDCASCHNTVGFALYRFDHDTQTDFALTGAHAQNDCAQCHVPGAGLASDTATSCVSCHRDDDVHRGRFGANCAQCHDTNDFRTPVMRGRR